MWFAEHAYTVKIDEKSNVYSFHVVLLELLSGRKQAGELGMVKVEDIEGYAPKDLLIVTTSSQVS